MTRRTTLIACAVLLLAGPAHAGDPVRGQERAASCAACHGADGVSLVPTFPSLAGQYEDYLLHSMRAYKNGTRTNPVMVAAVAAMNDRDLKDLAAFYAGQEKLRAPSVPAISLR